MITYITGGERSGKSSFAQKIVLNRSKNPVFLATARILDKEMEARVARHRIERDASWELIEEPLHISKHKLTNRTVLLDCITLWLTNVFYKNKSDLQVSTEWAKNEWKEFTSQDFELIVVSNEIGMGLHGNSEEARLFTQLQGFINQYVAATADEAWLMVSGIPIKLK